MQQEVWMGGVMWLISFIPFYPGNIMDNHLFLIREHLRCWWVPWWLLWEIGLLVIACPARSSFAVLLPSLFPDACWLFAVVTATAFRQLSRIAMPNVRNPPPPLFVSTAIFISFAMNVRLLSVIYIYIYIKLQSIYTSFISSITNKHIWMCSCHIVYIVFVKWKFIVMSLFTSRCTTSTI